MRLALDTKIVVAFAVSFAILLTIGIAGYRSTARLIEDAQSVKSNQEALLRLATLLSLLTDAETAQRGYVITGDETILDLYYSARERVPVELGRLRALLENDAVRKEKVDALGALAARRLELIDQVIAARREQGREAALQMIIPGEGRRRHDEFRAAVAELELAVQGPLGLHEQRNRATVRTTRAIIVIGIATALVLMTGALLVINRDARRRAELELRIEHSDALQRAILNSAEYAVIAGDANGITLFNRGAERLLGYQADELVGKQTAAIFHDPAEIERRARELTSELGAPVEPGMEAFLAKARTGVADENEWTYVRKDGSRVPVSLSVTAFHDPVKGAQSFVGIARDITERKRAEAALLEAKEKAEAADRVKSAFLATMSHELRTPLNSILGFTGVLLQELAGPLNPEQRKQLGMVRNSARRLLALINDVLDISKIEAGELRVAREPFDVREAVESVAETARPLAEKKGLALSVELPPEIGLVVADRRRVEQILLNLVGNAIKFTDRGKVVIRVEGPAGPNSPIRFSVSDCGPGIKPEDLATLFQPFRQVDSTSGRRHEGTGLGLAISARLAALMGGDLHAESVYGRGSTFTFTLPPGGTAA